MPICTSKKIDFIFFAAPITLHLISCTRFQMQVRSFNEYLASDWSRRTLISNNPRCGWGSGLQAASGAETLMYAATILIY